MRALIADAAEMAGVIEGGLCRAKTNIHRDTGSAQPRMALASDLGIGILNRRHHPLDAGRDHRVGAGRRFAEM